MMKYLLFLSIFFIGCYSEKKAAKQLQKIETEYPALLPEKCFELYPPKTITDSVIYNNYIDRIDTLISITTDTISVKDTILKNDCSKIVNRLSKKLQSANLYISKLKDDVLKNPPYIIKTIIDSSKVASLTIQNNELTKQKEDYRTRVEVMNKVCIWLLVILIVLISYIYVIEAKPKLHKPN